MATYSGTTGNDSLTGGNPADSLYGGAGNDTLAGAGGNDGLYGGTGHDLLEGGSGTDSLYGGADNDTLRGGTGADVLDGGTGSDTADYSTASGAVAVSLASGAGTAGDANGDTLSNIEHLTGSAYNDTLTGNDGDNLLIGGAGNDALSAGAGNDTLVGGAGADALNGGSGQDYVDYSASGAGVSLNLASGATSGGDAAGDSLSGIDGVFGSAHDDTITGFDQQGLSGDVYTNIFYGGAGNDWLDGAGGNDVLYGGADADTLLGGAGDDSLYGDAGDDALNGGKGNDALFGGTGNDLLQGGDGADTLTGGQGSDRFYGGAGDIIDGNEDGDETDVLDLTGLGPHRIVYDPLNHENGTVQFLDAQGTVTGTLTFSNIEQVVPCFTPGTRIVTERGERRVEDLQPGDRVLTRDNGLQAIRWIGRRDLGPGDLMASPALQPVRIAQGALGLGLPEQDLVLSRQHRMLMTGYRAELMFGEDEVLVRAQHLCALPGVEELRLSAVSYIHILFDRHELVLANGAWSESFQPGARSLDGMEDDTRAEIFALFPELAQNPGLTHFGAARMSLKSHEARALLLA